MAEIQDINALADRIPDGAHLALPPEYSFVPMQLVRCLIRRQARELRILCVPLGGLAVDMLIGAGCVAEIEAAAVSLGENGLAPRFTDAVLSHRVSMKDSTCPALHTALQAAEKGVPFMPLGGIIGSDIAANRPDWRIVDDPMGQGNGRILLIPAIRPDFAILHSPLADRNGNVWIGRRRELVTMAHAAKQTLVTVESFTDTDLLADEKTAAGTLPALYVTALAEAVGGARPLALTGCYERDDGAIAAYAQVARTDAGFADYLARTVGAHAPEAAE
ncbi:MAG: CoA synthetase [Rhodospirillales bacterium]|nr:CoA synthetase [Rhodospirillales bacterium]